MILQLLVLSKLIVHLVWTVSAQENPVVAPVDRPSLQEYYRICPLPDCNNCPTVQELRAPGIGFALGINHGTAAVRLHNGTIRDVALIEAGASYTDLMLRLATGPMFRTPHHLDTNWEQLQYLKSRALRFVNKLVGRPATPETAILADMVSRLSKATQMWLGDEKAIVAVVLSSPDRIQLTDEKIGDIFDYMKLQSLMRMPGSLYQLYATSAAYAGYGKGLCHNYTDAYACEREMFGFPSQRVLHLDFNVEALSGTMKSLQSVEDVLVDTCFVDPNLGLGRRTGDDEDDKSYWELVTKRIRELARSVEHRVYMPHATVLLLTGSSASNERFNAAIKDALRRPVASNNMFPLLETLHKAPDSHEEWQPLFTFAVARGAAEIAKRVQEGPVHCEQSEECKQRRERVHNEGLSVSLKHQSGYQQEFSTSSIRNDA